MKEFKYDARGWLIAAIIIELIIIIIFLINHTTKALKASLIVSMFITLPVLLIYFGAKLWGPQLSIGEDFIKIGRKKITTDCIRSVEIKNLFLVRTKGDAWESFKSNPEPNIYGARIKFLKPLGEEKIITFIDYYNYQQLIEELEQFLIRNSIPYEIEPDKLRRRKKSKENKENINT